MTEKVYIVCDIKKIPEQACEHALIYVREVQSSDVQAIRMAERELENMLEINDMHSEQPQFYSPEKLLCKLHEREKGKFKGLYIVLEASPTLPKTGFTYDKIPEEWNHVNDPFKNNIGQTNIGDVVKDLLWWNLTT